MSPSPQFSPLRALYSLGKRKGGKRKKKEKGPGDHFARIPSKRGRKPFGPKRGGEKGEKKKKGGGRGFSLGGDPNLEHFGDPFQDFGPQKEKKRGRGERECVVGRPVDKKPAVTYPTSPRSREKRGEKKKKKKGKAKGPQNPRAS